MPTPTSADADLHAFAQELAAMIDARPPEAIRQDLAAGCWIYGGGEYGQQLCGALLDQGYPVLGFIDRRAGPNFATLLDQPVHHPDDFTADQARGRAFVGAVINPLGGPAEIMPFANSLPFGAVVVGADAPDALGDAANSFWQGSRTHLLDNIDAIRAVCGRLADQQSIDAMLGILRYRVTGANEVHPASNADDMYLPTGFPDLERPITFVDGGAYIGDTCAHMLDHGVELARYIAFEPDQANLKRLMAYVDRAPIGEATILPCGLADTLRDLNFAGSKGLSSRLADNAPTATVATTTIRCVALDEVLPGLTPDFIKLDVEGAEMAALNGMKKTLTRARPRLAACLYHRPQDIWEIPAFVSQIYDKVYIRQHGDYGWDTVLYALPGA